MSELPSISGEVLQRLIAEGREIWDEFQALRRKRFHLFIPCDHEAAYEALRPLVGRAQRFLEFGSAAGVVTIIADLLGLEAYGIEMEPLLVERSLELAERFGSGATFAEGSYVPAAFQEEVEHLSADFMTPTVGSNAYRELGFELSDFDLIYAYPWPGEEDWLCELVRTHARPEARLLTYDVTEGYRLIRD